MKKKLLLIIIFIISFLLTSCNVYSHTHNYQDGQCGCGEKDPDYVAPHVHEYKEGLCECGEKDPDYIAPHVHEYKEGLCECGEWMPNYGETLTIKLQEKNESYFIEIDSGDIITYDLLFMETSEESIVLYYDKDFVERYHFEPIYYDTVLYIKWINKDELRDMAREAFYELFFLSDTKTLLEQIVIYKDYGIYGDCFVGIIQKEKSAYFDVISSREVIEDLVFEFSDGYEVFAYHEGMIYHLGTAYKYKLLSYKDILKIYYDY